MGFGFVIKVSACSVIRYDRMEPPFPNFNFRLSRVYAHTAVSSLVSWEMMLEEKCCLVLKGLE
jgi:hypothetical protein